MIRMPWSDVLTRRARFRSAAPAFVALVSLMFPARDARGDEGSTREASVASVGLSAHASVVGASVEALRITGPGAAAAAARFDELASTPRTPGRYRLEFDTPAGARAVEVPPCAGRGAVFVDGRPATAKPTVAGEPKGPLVVDLPAVDAKAHVVGVELDVGAYERRVACGYAPRAGETRSTSEGFGLLEFASPSRAQGGGRAVVYAPRAAANSGRRPLLVGPHPWNGGVFTYAAYAELVAEAETRGVVLLFPSGLGNSLYTAEAEREVVRATDEALARLPLDATRVSIWGASMGGAGATTIAFHRPSRFASVTSFFGDSKYDLATYVKNILRDARGAHAVDALDVALSARHLDVLLVHGKADRVSSPKQSEVLDAELKRLGFPVRLELVDGAGHEGALVARFAREVVARAERLSIPKAPTRVSFASARPEDTEAYGVRVARASATKDALVDLEAGPKGEPLRVHALSGVSAVTLSPGALGLRCDAELEGALRTLSQARGVAFRCVARSP